MGPRKTFKNELNPAMQFISRPGVAPEPEEAPSADPGHAPEAPARPHGKPPAGYKPNPAYIETKSKRLQLLVQPSLLEKIRARAKAAGTSVNDYVHSVLEDETEGEE